MTFSVRTPLRLATEHAVRLGVVFTVAEVATHADALALATTRYLTRLVADGVLVRDGDGLRRGPGAAKWAKAAPKTRPGGDAKDYRRRQAVLDAWRKRDWDAKRAGGAVLMRQPATARDNSCQSEEIMPDEAYLTVREAAAMIGVSPRTVWRMWSKGKIRVIKIGAQIRRVPQSDLIKAMEEMERKLEAAHA